MKTKHLKRFFLSIAITAFVAILAGNAFAANQNAARDGDSTTLAPQAYSNDFIVAAPYWQVASDSLPSWRLAIHLFQEWLQKLVSPSTLSPVQGPLTTPLQLLPFRLGVRSACSLFQRTMLPSIQRISRQRSFQPVPLILRTAIFVLIHLPLIQIWQ